jgi:predicted membrane metal-binding protein
MLRERIYARVAERQSAGLIAALVVGDQSAIDGPRQKSFSLT